MERDNKQMLAISQQEYEGLIPGSPPPLEVKMIYSCPGRLTRLFYLGLCVKFLDELIELIRSLSFLSQLPFQILHLSSDKQMGVRD